MISDHPRAGVRRNRSQESGNLTRAQYLMWLGQQLNPDAPLYNMIQTFTLTGSLDRAAFGRAWQALVDGSDALRTVVDVADGVPRQRVLPPAAVGLEWVDLSEEADPQAALTAWVERRKVRVLALDERLWDTALLRLGPQQHVWYLCQHHLITDGQAFANTYRAMAGRYGLALAGRLGEAEPLPAYADYVEHERAQRASAAGQKAAAYWREKVAAPIPPLDFYGRSAGSSGPRTDRITVDVGAGRSLALRAVAQTEGFASLSMDMSLYTVWGTILLTLLHRISGQERLRLGTPFMARATPTFRETIGLFIEIGVLQATIGEGETFVSLGEQVLEETFGGLMNVQPGISDAAINRSYDVLLNFVNARMGDFAGLPVTTDWIHTGYGDSDHALRVQIVDFDATGRFQVHLDVNVDLFGDQQRHWLVDQLNAVVDAFLADPTRPLGSFDLLSERERQAFLVEFNQTDADYPRDKTVVDLFRAQAAATPNAVAAARGAATLTYAALEARSNQLAYALMARGVGAETPVAICMPRSLEVLVAICGVIKAGGCYVPVDPAYPPQRLAATLEDAAPALLLTRGPLDAGGSDVPQLDLLDPALGLDAFPATPPAVTLTPAQLVYMIYTSGSTGRPKGAMLTHRGLVNYATWALQAYAGGQARDFPLYSSLAFDLTVTSLFVPLIGGGRIVIYSEEDHPKGLEILQVFADDAVDVVKLTPAHLALVGETEIDCRRIQTLIVGGEEFKTEVARAIDAALGGRAAIFNEYGPTEAVVGCMIHQYDPARDVGRAVPIGTPAANARIYVLDGYGQPAPGGVAGEMVISSDGVARGYHNRPLLTAERFGDDPFRPGARIYRSGDLARWNGEDMLDFLGRRDHQVKIRGARIELGEIEAALLAHPGVDAAVVDVYAGDAAEEEIRHCAVCGLPSNYPDADLDADDVCADCRAYARYEQEVARYWRTPDDLRLVLAGVQRAHAEKQYDCIVLLSGGKDSTYMLYQLVQEYGLNPLAFTLDNGFISAEALDNIRRACDDLGVDVRVATTPHMNAIFADSLRRHSNVCNGCFKTIYTLSMSLARRLGINTIITGLARGQLFETRLADTFRARQFDPQQIDRWVMEARKAYHQINDAVFELLEGDLFQDSRIFDEIHFVDFYRYVDVDLAKVYAFLEGETVWRRPSDTGRSTNCLINDAGIYVHQLERGYHNYALPYSWDVRLGHKVRDEAMDELDDDIDQQQVAEILDAVGYTPRPLRAEEKRLVAYVTGRGVGAADVRSFLAARLPDFMVPTYVVPLEAIPLTVNGKVDRRALPAPDRNQPETRAAYVAPVSVREQRLADIWSQVLRVDDIGVDDNFLELGGDSIISIQIVAAARRAGLHLTPRQLFTYQTIAELAPVVAYSDPTGAEQGQVSGDVPLTPIQRWFFAQAFENPHQWNQSLWLALPPDVDLGRLREALQLLPRQHDALRLRFRRGADGGWTQTLPAAPVGVGVHVAANLDEATMTAQARALEGMVDIENGPLLQAGLFPQGPHRPVLLFMTIHHLAVDGVSWRPLLEDLAAAYDALTGGTAVDLPPKTTSFRQWAQAVTADDFLAADRAFWQDDRPVQRLASTPAKEYAAGDSLTVSTRLGEETTAALLHEAGAAYHSSVNDALLAATAQAFHDALGWQRFSAMLEGHGREDQLVDGADLSRTVGWFTTHFPLHVDLDAPADPGATLVAVKEGLRAIPNHGLGFGVQDDQGNQPDVLFNYLGQFERSLPDSDLFTLNRPLQAGIAPGNRRTHALEIAVYVYQGALHSDWVFHPGQVDEALVARLAAAFDQRLRRLVDHCRAVETPRFTPSDFDLAGFDAVRFQQFVEAVGAEEMANVVDVLPLTPTQAGILYHTVRDPESDVYREQISAVLEGPLDESLLRAAWEDQVARHAMLRTRFLWETVDEPLQLVTRAVALPWEVVDWQEQRPEDVPAALDALLAERRRRRFDLSTAPLLRFLLVRESDRRTHFIWFTHHLIVDGWSTHLLFNEALRQYESLVAGERPASPPARPFRDYVAWLQRQDLAEAEAYWRETLRDFAAPTPLNVDRRAGDGPVRYGERQLALPASTTAALQGMARRERLTLNTLVQAAWGILLGRYSGGDDVVFGTTVSGRPADLPHVEQMVGMFINTLPLRLRPADDAPLLPWLRDVQERLLGLRSREFTPLADVQRWSELPAGQGLFESLVVFENYPDSTPEAPGSVRVADLQYREQSNYPLALLVVPGEQLQLLTVFDRTRFDEATIERLLGHVARLLSDLAAGQAQRVGDLTMVTPAERETLLRAWNDTAQPAAPERLLHQLVAIHGERTPEAPAVSAAGRTLRYGELERQANQLAHFLRAQGAGPGRFVGLYATRRVELISGILGILKAGAAYVPIDADYPAERIAHIVDDAGLDVIVTAGAGLPDVAAHRPVTVLDLDSFDYDAWPATLPDGQPKPDQPAYAIFTSGSTGKPKGVLVSHRNIVHSTSVRAQVYPQAPGRFLLLSSFAFDSAMVGIFWTLCSGGTLILPDPGLQQDVVHLNGLIAAHRVTHLLALPALYQLLLTEGTPAEQQSLNSVIVAGEACHAGLVGDHYARLPQATLYNEYGPTEGTVWSHVYPFPREFRGPAVPIGRAIPNVTQYVLDRANRPVPIGVPGELVLGGAGIALGYLRRPELTAERFVHLPAALGVDPQARFYRTGDLVQWLPDGNLLFLGRVDQQVKIRGFRVETGEIESVLADHPAVQAAAVAAVERPGGTAESGARADLRLAAWVETAAPVTADQLRDYLAARLPDFMVPAYFVLLEALPRTANGKINRRVLPAPEAPVSDEADYAPPTTAAERILTDIWQTVLRLPRVGIDDNFFDLGGDSIISIQIVARARRAGLKLSPRAVFQRQTVRELAAAAQAVGGAADQAPSSGTAPLTPIQRWFFAQNFAAPDHWNQSLWLEAARPLDPDLLAAAATALVAHHDALRLRFRQGDDGWTQQFDPAPAPLTVTVADAPDQAALDRAAARADAGLDLAAGPLLALTLCRRGAALPDRLYVTIHHLVVDGISWQPLLADLETAYRQLAAGEPLRLPPRTTSFQTWAQQLRAYVADERRSAADRAYWGPERSYGRLPEPAGGTNLEADGRTVTVKLDVATTRRLLQEAGRRYGNTVQELLLAAAAQALAQTLALAEPPLLLEGHGREEIVAEGADLSRTAGWFTSRYPLTLDGAADPRTALLAVKEQLRAVPNFGIGYGLLRYLDGDLAPQLAAEPNVAFNYLGQLDRGLHSGSLLTPAGPLRGAVSPRNRRPQALGVLAFVQEGALHAVWDYHPATVDDDTATQLAARFLSRLTALLDHVSAADEREYTTADFDLAGLDADEFDQLADLLSGLDE